MPVEPVSQTLAGIILKKAQKEDEKQRRSGYWILCPSCGRKVVKKQLIKKGCYLCNWKGTEEEIKQAQDKQVSLQSLRKQAAFSVKIENLYSFKTECPKCGRQVMTEELKEKGCYLCGYKLK